MEAGGGVGVKSGGRDVDQVEAGQGKQVGEAWQG